MSNQNLSDQVAILEAINNVRMEMQLAHSRGASPFEMRDITVRLVNLYSLLNVRRLAQVAADMDAIENSSQELMAA